MEQKNKDLNSKDLTNNQNENTAEKKIPPKKPPKIEDKPFNEFINDYLIPGVKESLSKKNIIINELTLSKSIRPVVGDECWVLFGEIDNNKRFWLCFDTDNISAIKTISLAESETEPGLVESFLIDEKKITLSLLISRLLQRLNGQKWIGAN